MCEEESEDHEAVAKLFEINDSIHRTVERYKLFKKGDIEGANKIPQGTLGKSGAGVSKGPDNTLNLIDFGDPEPVPAAAEPSASQPASMGNALEDDLLGLSLGGPSYGQTGSIALGGSNGSGKFKNAGTVLSLTSSSPRYVWNAGAPISAATTAYCTIHQRPVWIDAHRPNFPALVATGLFIRTNTGQVGSIDSRSVRRAKLSDTPSGFTHALPTISQTTNHGSKDC